MYMLSNGQKCLLRKIWWTERHFVFNISNFTMQQQFCCNYCNFYWRWVRQFFEVKSERKIQKSYNTNTRKQLFAGKRKNGSNQQNEKRWKVRTHEKYYVPQKVLSIPFGRQLHHLTIQTVHRYSKTRNSWCRNEMDMIFLRYIIKKHLSDNKCRKIRWKCYTLFFPWICLPLTDQISVSSLWNPI